MCLSLLEIRSPGEICTHRGDHCLHLSSASGSLRRFGSWRGSGRHWKIRHRVRDAASRIAQELLHRIGDDLITLVRWVNVWMTRVAYPRERAEVVGHLRVPTEGCVHV